MQYKRVLIIECALVLMLLCACGQSERQAAPVTVEKDESISDSSLEAQDTAVFLGTDKAAGAVTLQSADNGMKYELKVNDMTEFSDKYGGVCVVQQFVPGDIVDVTISVHSKTLLTMKNNAEAFEKDGISSFTINMNRGVFSTDDGNYRITEKTAVISDGQESSADVLKSGDVVTIKGIDRDILSLIVESGNGHVRVTGTEYFTAGWLQIGRSIIKPITDEMLIDVPEGDYDLVVIYHGHGGTRHISVKRGEETSVDVSDLKGELIKSGRITFSVTPPDAMPMIKINGQEIDYLQPVELEYGVYALEVSAEGYQTINEKISVGQEMANLDIELQPADSTSSDSAVSKSSSSTAAPKAVSAPTIPTPAPSTPSAKDPAESGESGNAVSTATGTNRLYIDAPEGAEVYYDGAYKGIAPCNFKKSSGTHVITLREDGYETRTYTITLDDSTDNETYSFNELEASE